MLPADVTITTRQIDIFRPQKNQVLFLNDELDFLKTPFHLSKLSQRMRNMSIQLAWVFCLLSTLLAAGVYKAFYPIGFHPLVSGVMTIVMPVFLFFILSKRKWLKYNIVSNN